MSGRHILEGVIVLHETIHELHRKNMDGVLFKIDFEKAYDKVKWSYRWGNKKIRFLSISFFFGKAISIKENTD
jgi:hypothetical protein